MKRSYVRTEETRRRTAESLRRAHALNPRTSESRDRISKSVKKAHEEGRAGGFKQGNDLWRKRTPEGAIRATQAAVQRCLGQHGFGRMKLGRLDHCRAKAWVIESPTCERFSFTNLLEWCRQNEHRFRADRTEHKQPLWKRAANGIARHHGAAIHIRDDWRGWKLISVADIPCNLERNEE